MVKGCVKSLVYADCVAPVVEAVEAAAADGGVKMGAAAAAFFRSWYVTSGAGGAACGSVCSFTRKS